MVKGMDMKKSNDNQVLAEFAQQVRTAGDHDKLPLPWEPSLLVGPHHQAAIVALFESGLLGFKKTSTGGKVYCSSRTHPIFRLHGIWGSIFETLGICILLLTLFSIGARISDFVGMLVAGIIFLVLMYRGLLTSQYFHLFGNMPLDHDSQGRIRNGLMFVASWFSAAMATYFFRRLFVLDVYSSDSAGLIGGIIRAFGDGIWWQVVVQDFMKLHFGGPWWGYLLAPVFLLIPFMITWYLLWGVTTVAANLDASKRLLAQTGMYQRFTDTIPLTADDRSKAGTVAVYSSLIAAFVFFYSIHYYEELAAKLF